MKERGESKTERQSGKQRTPPGKCAVQRIIVICPAKVREKGKTVILCMGGLSRVLQHPGLALSCTPPSVCAAA